ncbi:hypothetical protein PTI98_007110 [Pleurotus ostreatus]|nr:hypothetical protein PTI98_007110 [Pleurotus ostreatus]
MEPVSIIPLEKLRAGDGDNQRTASMISNQEVFDMLDSNVPFWLGSHGFERLRSFATNILYKFIKGQEEDWKKIGAGKGTFGPTFGFLLGWILVSSGLKMANTPSG